MSKAKNLPLKILKIVLAIVVIGAAASLIAIWQIGAWNLVFPTSSHDTVAPTIPADLKTPAVLVFSKTNGFRHVEGIDGGAKILQSIASSHKWGMFHTENGAVFNARDLEKFDVVVFLNASGDMLSAAQESAFQSWLLAGGGWLGLHAAGDSSHLEWQWYRDNLIGATFTAHIMGPQFQTASVVLENHQHPALQDLPNIWQHEEEWYSWEQSPRLEGFTVLATLDESSYVPEADFMGTKTDLRMGDHPVVWTNCIGKGKSVYAAMGHRAEAFEQPQNRRLLENTLTWLMDTRGQACD
ncbi:Uncharacterised protein [Halioglobus japonicus]|nr:Uncharacterised protein [Halioglobus japonicus]